MSASAPDIARYLDDLLGSKSIPDYPAALNGLQCEHRGPVTRIAAAVDFSIRTIEGAVDAGANFLLVHHGMFWDAPRPLAGAAYRRLRLLLSHDIAVYASHLPLDAHLSMGNAVLLARELGLVPSLPFAHFQGVPIGTAGESDVGTTELLERADRFAKSSGGAARATPSFPGRRSRRWAICTGSGASTDTLREAAQLRIDTLIVGEGPHHTVVDATDEDLVVIYAGHYATETLGVQAVAAHVSERFGVPWDFIFAPTGS